jgi:hypothetical protein
MVMANSDVDEEHCRIYRQEGNGHPSDLKDAEWVRLEPLIPEASPGGRPRKTDIRAAMNPFSICCAPAAHGVNKPPTGDALNEGRQIGS